MRWRGQLSRKGAVKIVQEYDEKVQGLVQDYEDEVKRLEAEKTGLKENAAKAVKDFERAERLVKYYEGEVENLEVEKEVLMEGRCIEMEGEER